MNQVLKRVVPMACVTILMAPWPGLASTTKLEPPKDRQINVAVVLTESATMIDFAGPWEVFQDVMIPERGNTHEKAMPFKLFTVGASRKPIRVTGGMRVTPDYTFADAPVPDIVVVGAQRGAPELTAWLQKQRGRCQVMMSVCTGAFKFAAAGLFDGKQATTHHDYFDQFRERYPKVTLVTGRRYVQADEQVFSAGGLTSGIDLALHVVELYFGREIAERTANYMEYQSTAWRDGAVTSARGVAGTR